MLVRQGIVSLCATLLASALCVSLAFAYSGGPPNGRAGDPPNFLDCTNGCHLTSPVNSGDGTLAISGLPSSYEPGVVYPLTVALADPEPERARWGFELTVIKESDQRQAGELEPGNPAEVQKSAGSGDARDYLKHRSAGTFPGQLNGATWDILWTAPAAGTGAAHFYVAGNAANNDDDNTGDLIYTRDFLIPEATTDAPELPAGSLFAMEAYPNPAQFSQEIRFSVPHATTGTLHALDASGRIVRTVLPRGLVPAGSATLSWDGRDDHGALLPAGVYFVRLTLADQSLTRSVVWIR